jgi:hypothetical protein
VVGDHTPQGRDTLGVRNIGRAAEFCKWRVGDFSLRDNPEVSVRSRGYSLSIWLSVCSAVLAAEMLTELAMKAGRPRSGPSPSALWDGFCCASMGGTLMDLSWGWKKPNEPTPCSSSGAMRQRVSSAAPWRPENREAEGAGQAYQPSRARYGPRGARGRHAVGSVSIWAQWLGAAAGVLLSPVFVLFFAWFISWPLLRRLWPHAMVAPASAPGSGRRAGAAPPG